MDPNSLPVELKFGLLLLFLEFRNGECWLSIELRSSGVIVGLQKNRQIRQNYLLQKNSSLRDDKVINGIEVESSVLKQ